MKIAIIGAGNIGGAMAKGLLVKSIIAPSDLTLTTAHKETLQKYADLRCNLTLDDNEAVQEADIIVIAVKPWKVAEVVRNLKDAIDYTKQIVVCIVAGVPSAELLPEFDKEDGSKVRLVYAMPNTAIEIGESVTFLTNVSATADDMLYLRKLYDQLGYTLKVEERLLQAGTSLASCGIAYAMRYARAATLGGVQLGFKSQDALEIVEQTVIGAMKLLIAHDSHPEAEIDTVTTPGGITINGLIAMEDAGFTTAVINGLKAAKFQ